MAQTGEQTRELSKALSESRGIFLHLAAFSFFVNLLMLTGPLYMLQVYDRVLMSQSVETLVALTLLVLVLYVALAFLEWVRSQLFNEASSGFEDVLGDRAGEAALHLGLSRGGVGSDKPLRDLRTIRRFLSGPAPKAMFDAPWSPLFFLVLFALHWIYGLWALFGAVVLLCLGLLNQRASMRQIKETEQHEYGAQLRASEMVRNSEVLHAMGMNHKLKDRWRHAFDSSDAALSKSGSILSGFTSGTKSFRLFLQSAILGIGAYLSIIGVSTPGAMIAASILMGRAIAPIEQTVGQLRSITNVRDAWRNLRDAIDHLPPEEGKIELPPIRGHVTVENVYAAPLGATKPTLKALNFEVMPGEALGVVGSSAAGKSSLARVLLGIWKPLSGHVRIDGGDLASWPRESIGPQLGYLPQQVDLLAGTVKENICRFDANPKDNDIIEAAMAANCHELILGLPDGYESEIGAGGSYLSAGQRQRIGLARALYGNPNLVILDEPNANLDGPGEQALHQAIKGLLERRASVIIIAHRPNAIMQCHKLLVLDQGEVKAFGPREEVLQKILPQRANKAQLRPVGGNNG